MKTALEICFWVCAGLIAWTQLGYALALALLARVLPAAREKPRAASWRSPARGGAHHQSEARGLPSLSLIVAAHDEQHVIGAKVHNALALDYPRERLEVIVACDGCSDATARSAREAGADLVLELARGGKIRAQDAAVAQARGEIVAFSDANALWHADADWRAPADAVSNCAGLAQPDARSDARANALADAGGRRNPGRVSNQRARLR